MIEDIKSTFKQGSILTKLIYINIAVFLPVWFLSLFFPIFESFVALPGTFKELLFKPWTLVTYMFVHGGFWHLLMNMLWLFWLGRMFLDYFHSKQLAAVYLIGGFAGAGLHLLANYLTHVNVSMIGASAAVMSIVFAVVAYKPDRLMHLMFIGPVKMKYVGIVVFIIDLMGLAGSMKVGVAASGGVAHLAHMGGSLFGLWFGFAMRNNKDITSGFVKFLDSIFSLFSSGSSKKYKNMRVKKNKNRFEKPKSDSEHNQSRADNQEEINRILDKISKSGYNSLSSKEKQFLFKQKDK